MAGLPWERLQEHHLQSGECIYVPTGGILPEGADAVVMIEYAEQIGKEILVKRPVAHGENVLFFNEDFSSGDVVCNRGRRLTPQDIGVLAAAGCIDVPVVRIPKIGILSTGNELVPVNCTATARTGAGCQLVRGCLVCTGTGMHTDTLWDSAG